MHLVSWLSLRIQEDKGSKDATSVKHFFLNRIKNN